jgi:hypothetical protein
MKQASSVIESSEVIAVAEQVTEKGFPFISAARVKIGDRYYDMDALSLRQKEYVSGKLLQQALNGANRCNEAIVVEGLPSFDRIFSEQDIL